MKTFELIEKLKKHLGILESCKDLIVPTLYEKTKMDLQNEIKKLFISINDKKWLK